jgi:toxin-antitoxin system PIN domain toxin
MSFTIDANILLYAVNKDSLFHVQAKSFIESCAENGKTWHLSWAVIHTFIRISTHPKIMSTPLAPEEAVSVIEQILNLPNVQTMGDNEQGFWEIYKEEIKTAHLRGNQISDAIIVATMKAYGIRTIYTKDRDFLRFRGIKAIDPISSK